MRIRDGSATRNRLRTLKATGRKGGKAGVRSEARSQDTDSIVLVSPTDVGHFSAKRRMRPACQIVFWQDSTECLHSPFCWGLKVFLLSASRAGLSIKLVRIAANTIED